MSLPRSALIIKISATLPTGSALQVAKNPVTFIQVKHTTVHKILSVLLIVSFQASVERRAVTAFIVRFRYCL